MTRAAEAVPLDLIACPACHGELRSTGAGLVCAGCERSYGSSHGVPVLTLEQGSPSPTPNRLASAIQAVASNPRLNDWVQRRLALADRERWLRPVLEESAGTTLIDVGAGTGSWAEVLPSSTRYVWLDQDERRLRRFRARRPDAPAAICDVTALPLRDDCADDALCIEVAHHLTDEGLARLVHELARVVRRRLVFVEPAPTPGVVSNLLWRYDPGSFLRSEELVERALEQAFTIERKDEHASRFYRHVAWIARPAA